MLALLLVHAVVLPGYALLRHHGLAAVLAAAAVPALGAWSASRPALSRRLAASIASLSVMLTSAVVVHLSDGYIESHFHFFAMVAVIAVYEDWVPFGLGVAVVVLHHGVMGTMEPHAVYDHPAAWAHPWRFAAIHGGFFALTCGGSLVNWRLHETARSVEQGLTLEMAHRAAHDLLTGLPNRVRFLESSEQTLAECARDGSAVAVLILDLDRFKEINDVLGHACGDQLLAVLGSRLATAVRGADTFARLGGDEFAAVLADTDGARAERVAGRLLALLDETVEIGGVALSVDASVGIAVCPAGGELDIATLLRRADIAMYTAKRTRARVTVYEPGQDDATRERLALVGELRQALAHSEIVVHFQPKVALPGLELRGVEALARWEHPARGLLAPYAFIPAAESTGLILPLTLLVLDIAVRQVARWQERGHDIPVAVNLSPRCLGEGTLTAQILAVLDRYGVPAPMLKLEITENTLADDPERARATLTSLHDAGVLISIDDFGTGYSSMSHLRRLPVSELKVDRSFVAEMLTRADDAVLVRSVIELGHNLGLVVVAEGVEDLPTLTALEAVGCDLVQGFHIARPMPADAFDDWLQGHLRTSRQLSSDSCNHPSQP